jgi:hypothetical protein
MRSREDVYNFDALIGPWGSIADIDELWPRYDSLDPNNEAEMKDIIREDIIPYFQELSNERKESALKGLRYILSLSDEDINSEWDGILPGFDLPNDPRDLFIWMQEVFEEHQIHLTPYE